MSGDAIHPPIAWAQRKDILYLTVQVEDLKDKEVNCTEDKLSFKATGGQPSRAYAVELEFFKNVDSSSVREKPSGNQLLFIVKKAEGGPFWPRLLKDSKKVNWLKTDFEKWRDEDDSDLDEPVAVDNDFESQMASLGGNYGDEGDENDAPADNEDSDDDALPDLE